MANVAYYWWQITSVTCKSNTSQQCRLASAFRSMLESFPAAQLSAAVRACGCAAVQQGGLTHYKTTVAIPGAWDAYVKRCVEYCGCGAWMHVQLLSLAVTTNDIWHMTFSFPLNEQPTRWRQLGKVREIMCDISAKLWNVYLLLLRQYVTVSRTWKMYPLLHLAFKCVLGDWIAIE